MKLCRGLGRSVSAAIILLAAFSIALAASDGDAVESTPTVLVPRIGVAPKLDDFAAMRPSAGSALAMARVEGFTQVTPNDGRPSSQRTDVYLGYDDTKLYVVFVAFDDRPDLVRARMASRERTDGDDQVTVTLDTYNDRRRGYGFVSNPLGIQQDFLETDEAGRDITFDTVWQSTGRMTDEGYVVVMSIPFRSLRYPEGDEQRWGILLERWIARDGEQAFWPTVSANIQGRLSQEARLDGIRGISAGKSMQFIPYVSMRSSRELDTRDPARPGFVDEPAKLDAGLDAKFVLKNALVLDLTVNPDFSQVESDEPLASSNERFELFVPEKRPFFLENADFFQTPLSLVFTRRVGDPLVGARLTGTVGDYTIGALASDDRSPGRRVAPNDPAAGSRAGVAVLRVARNLRGQSRVGLLLTDREWNGGYNRVGAVDARIRFNPNWSGEFQAATSDTRRPNGETLAGPAYRALLVGTGRNYHYEVGYRDISPGFVADLGFVPRADIRTVFQNGQFTLRPEGRHLLSYGPRVFLSSMWDHIGNRVYLERSAGFDLNFRRQTSLSLWTVHIVDGLRPSDYSALDSVRQYSRKYGYLYFGSRAFSKVAVTAEMRFAGTAVNFNPAAGLAPEIVGRGFDGNLTATIQPAERLRVDNSYLLTRLTDRETSAGVFVEHILRTKWSWQFSRALSLRAIGQWNARRTNPDLTSLAAVRRINGDLLMTYQLNPWTALYVGYNGNLENLELVSGAGGTELVRTPVGLRPDAQRFFVKFSYLFQM